MSDNEDQEVEVPVIEEEEPEIEDALAEEDAEPASMVWDLSKKEDDNPDQIPLFIEDPEAE
jgi:hypothetical protein